MAIPPFDCASAEDVCCTTLFDMAEFILFSVRDALADCMPNADCGCEPLDSYVTLSGDDGITNALTVEIQSVGPSPITATGSSGVQRPLGLQRVTFVVRLRESGWPMAYVDDNVIVAPDPTAQHFASRHAYAHGERMYRQLLFMLSTSTGFAPDGVIYTRASLSPLTALLPTAGVAGFFTSVTVDLNWGIGGSLR